MLFHQEHGNGSQSQLWAQILQKLTVWPVVLHGVTLDIGFSFLLKARDTGLGIIKDLFYDWKSIQCHSPVTTREVIKSSEVENIKMKTAFRKSKSCLLLLGVWTRRVWDKEAMTQGSTILTTIFIVLAVGEEKIKMFALRSLPITFWKSKHKSNLACFTFFFF